jgi:hypothetical protein
MECQKFEWLDVWSSHNEELRVDIPEVRSDARFVKTTEPL